MGHGTSDRNETYVAILASWAPDASPQPQERGDHGRRPGDAPEIEIPDHQPLPVRAVDDGNVVVANA